MAISSKPTSGLAYIRFATIWAQSCRVGRHTIRDVQPRPVELWLRQLELSPKSKTQARVRKARSLAVDQFHALLGELHEPFATMALLCGCMGLRISEALILRWDDVDRLQSRVSIRRGIVQQHVDECKTEGSAKTFVLGAGKRIAWLIAGPFDIVRQIPIRGKD